MWRILRETGIAPATAISGAADDGRMPEAAGVGFTDVGSGTPGTDSAQFTPQHFASWRPGFFGRLEAQARRASAGIGCTCGRCGAPALVAFSGKRQFAELFEAARKKRQGRKGTSVAAGAAAAVTAGGGGLPPDQPVAASPLQQQQRHASSSGTGAADQQLPTLQADRPSRIDTGRQWVLPAGWPLPLSTEVRLPVGGSPQATRACLCLRFSAATLLMPAVAPHLLNRPCPSAPAGMGHVQHQRGSADDARAAIRPLAGAGGAAAAGALAAWPHGAVQQQWLQKQCGWHRGRPLMFAALRPGYRQAQVYAFFWLPRFTPVKQNHVINSPFNSPVNQSINQ